jgi:hypothetical protein
MRASRSGRGTFADRRRADLLGSWDFQGTWRQGCPPDVISTCSSATGAFLWNVIFYDGPNGDQPGLVADILGLYRPRIVLDGSSESSQNTFSVQGKSGGVNLSYDYLQLSGTVDGDHIDATWYEETQLFMDSCCIHGTGTLTRSDARGCWFNFCPPGSVGTGN